MAWILFWLAFHHTVHQLPEVTPEEYRCYHRLTDGKVTAISIFQHTVQHKMG
jgi:hypothetical protein